MVAMIPRAEDIKRRAPSSGVQPIVQANLPTGGAVSNLSVTANQMREQADLKNKEQLSKAESVMALLKIEADEKAKNTPYDPNAVGDDSISSAWHKHMQEGLALSSSTIQDSASRQIFMDRYEPVVAKGQAKIDADVFNLETDYEIAELREQMDSMAKAQGDDILGNPRIVGDRWSALADAGRITREQAQMETDAYRDKTATEYVQSLPPEEQIAILNDSGAAKFTKHIAPHIIKHILDEAKATIRAQEAYDRVKGMIDKPPEVINEELNKITDVKEMEATRNQLNKTLAQDRQAKLAAQQQFYEEHLPNIQSGHARLEDIESEFGDEYGQIPVSQAMYANMRAEQQLRDKADAGRYVPTHSNAVVRDVIEDKLLNDATGNMSDAIEYYGENSSELNAADKRYFGNKFMAGKSGAKPDFKFKGVETTNMLMKRMFKQYSVTDEGDKSEMWTNLQQWAEDFYDENGKNATDAQITQRVMDEYTKIRRDPDAWIFDDDIYVKDMPDDEREDFFDAVRELRKIDPNISRIAIISRYENMLRKRNASQ